MPILLWPPTSSQPIWSDTTAYCLRQPDDPWSYCCFPNWFKNILKAHCKSKPLLKFFQEGPIYCKAHPQQEGRKFHYYGERGLSSSWLMTPVTYPNRKLHVKTLQIVKSNNNRSMYTFKTYTHSLRQLSSPLLQYFQSGESTIRYPTGNSLAISGCVANLDVLQVQRQPSSQLFHTAAAAAAGRTARKANHELVAMWVV